MLSRRYLVALPLLLASAFAQGQTWPTAKPITLIVPFTAGGSSDYFARLVATKLGERLKQSVVIENIAGAGGIVGVAKAVTAPPDGYTLVAAPDSVVSIGKFINPAAYRFDPLKDLVPVGLLNSAPMVLVVRADLPAKNFADFVKLAKAKPGKYSYATSGVGTVLQLGMEILKERSGIFVTHIPYRGGAQIVTDVVGGQVDAAMLIGSGMMPFINNNKLRALGTTGLKRHEMLPDVPTFAEMPGLAGYNIVSWTGIYAPVKTPPDIVRRLNQELNAVLSESEVRDTMIKQGARPGTGSAEELGRFGEEESARTEKIVKALNIKD